MGGGKTSVCLTSGELSPALLHGGYRLGATYASALYTKWGTWLFEGQVPVFVRGWRNLLSASLWWVGLRCIFCWMTLYSDMLSSGVWSTGLFHSMLWVWGRGRWLLGFLGFQQQSSCSEVGNSCVPFLWSCCDCRQGLLRYWSWTDTVRDYISSHPKCFWEDTLELGCHRKTLGSEMLLHIRAQCWTLYLGRAFLLLCLKLLLLSFLWYMVAWRRPFRQGCFVSSFSFMTAVYTVV